MMAQAKQALIGAPTLLKWTIAILSTVCTFMLALLIYIWNDNRDDHDEDFTRIEKQLTEGFGAIGSEVKKVDDRLDTLEKRVFAIELKQEAMLAK